jgi:hypothetical protein
MNAEFREVTNHGLHFGAYPLAVGSASVLRTLYRRGVYNGGRIARRGEGGNRQDDVRRGDDTEMQLSCGVRRLGDCGDGRVVRREEISDSENLLGGDIVEEGGEVVHMRLVLEKTSNERKRRIGEKRTSSSATTTSAVSPWVVLHVGSN